MFDRNIDPRRHYNVKRAFKRGLEEFSTSFLSGRFDEKN